MRERTLSFSLVAVVYLCAASAFAQQPSPAATPTAGHSAKRSQRRNRGTKAAVQVPGVTVYGSAVEPAKTDLSSSRAVNPASVTVVKYPEEVKRATFTYGDLLRPLTGVIVDNYGQGGLGYGIMLRGFDQLEHGRDVATFVDGVPENQTSDIQVNGYTDLNDLNPELVNKITLTRGPFDVRAGDFAIGGSVQYATLDLPPTGVTLMGGEFGAVRGNAIYSGQMGRANGFLSLMVDDTQGYRHNDSLFRLNTFDKINFPLANGVASLRFQFFNDTFGQPSYINRTLVEAGLLSDRTTINTTDGGNRAEENLVFNYRQPGSEQPLSINLYAVHNEFDRYATFTANALPINQNSPGQALSQDRRYQFGGNGDKFWLFSLPYGIKADLLVGAGIRNDVGSAHQFGTIAEVPQTHTIDVDFDIYNPFVYAQVDIKPVFWLKLTGGVRYDQFFYNDADRQSGISVSPDTGGFQPKGGVTITPLRGLDLFANIGEGLRSPSAVFDLPLNPSIGVTTVVSEEVGVQYNSPSGMWHFLGSVYTTNLSNEIQENPPPKPATNLGPSRRDGFDVEEGWNLFESRNGITFSLLGSYSGLRARLLGNQGGPLGSDVPNAPKWIAKYGAELRWPLFGATSPHVFFMYANEQFVGQSDLEPTGIFKAPTYTRLNLDAWYINESWQGAGAFLEIVAFPYGRLNQTSVYFGNGVVGISPNSAVAVQSGIHVPLNFPTLWRTP